MQVLLKQAIEAISFVLLLNDYKISDIIIRCARLSPTMEILTSSRCDPATQQTIGSLTFQGLFTSVEGRDAARRLVTSLIEQQIGQELGVS